MSIPSLQDVFQLRCLIENIEIKICARVENGVKQLIALVTSDGDIVLHYTFGELPVVVKRIPWFAETSKTIQTICFDPTATWLLVVSLDNSLYIIPALSLVDKKLKIDCKWSLNDITHFPKHHNTPESKPLCAVWWQTLDSNQNALVGYENGNIGLISLTDGRCIGVCGISEAIKQLHICHENGMESIFLLIDGESGQQWRLMLEIRASGYLWPPDAQNTNEDSSRSRLYNLKQLGVDKLFSLKQRIVDGKHSRRNSQTSDTASESSHSESSSQFLPELLPHLSDTYFSAQFAKNRHLFCAFYKPSSLLTVHAADVETAPLYVHKLPPRTDSVLLTDQLIYVIDDSCTVISIISAHLSENRTDGDSEFKQEALIGQYCIEHDNERILNVFKVTDTVLSLTKSHEHKKDKTYSLPKTVDDVHMKNVKIDTCVIVTNLAVYRIIISYSPIKKFIKFVNEDWNLVKAEKLAIVFGLNQQQLFETCGDLLIANNSFHQGLILYKQAKVHLLTRVLKLAVVADCKALLKFINLCLSASKPDMSMATKIHIGNLAVMAHTEMVLRHSGSLRLTYTKDFMKFLCYEEYYDQVLAVNVACQAGHWNIVTLLAKSRGLQPEVVAALSQVIQSSHIIRQTVGEFLYALSEPALTQSLLIYPACALPILSYIRNNLETFNVQLLKRFIIQLDPSQPTALPIVTRIFLPEKQHSSLDSTLDSVDFETSANTNQGVREFIETFIMVVLTLLNKTGDKWYNMNLLDKSNQQQQDMEFVNINKLPPLRPLSCGYEHAAVVRNNSVYTMGLATSGCLGLGPLLTQSSSPKLVQTLLDLKIKVLSVSCGRKHTIALTNAGVYSWGSNSYGQLGLGIAIQETPYPQLLVSLSHKHIIETVAGQYHSMALTANGEVYTWGWGIHGQLGHGTCNNEVLPTLLNFKWNIIQIAAGHAHSLILTVEGKVFGFGSNCFGQLGSCNIDSNKTTSPVWILIMPEIYTPVERIATAYFHNIAIRADQEVYTWGANPQEVRISQSKFSQKLNGVGCKIYEPWKNCSNIYSSNHQKPIDDVSAGYRFSTILHNGRLLWGRGRDGDLTEQKIRDQEVPGVNGQKFIHAACGPDFIMAIEHTGKVLAWGSNNMAQTILGRAYEEHRTPDGKVVLLKNTKRIIKIPSNVPGNSEGYPIEVPGLPTLAISYNITDPRVISNKNRNYYGILSLENKIPLNSDTKPLTRSNFNPAYLEEIPNIIIGQKTLHYVLETYYGYYDTELIQNKCLELHNYQAASKLALLDGHYCDSLTYQLNAFKSYMDTFTLYLDSYPKPDEYEINALGDLCPKNDKIDFNGLKFEFNHLNSPEHILSTSSSLDSIRQWGDDLDHQGGCESPCEFADIGDVKQSMTQYIQSVKNDNCAISSVSRFVEKPTNDCDKTSNDIDVEINASFKDLKTKEIIKTAAYIIEFYLSKTYASENHILMQNILLKCIEFWLKNNLPVGILEMVLLKNMDKYFYPLSILLFCKNFNNNLVDEIIQNGTMQKQNSAGFLKEFSTKFCLQLCSMVLENVNKS